jgi:hypothetical protein
MNVAKRSAPEQAAQPTAVDDLRRGDADDDAIRTLVIRLSRAHPSGGRVIERAAILAAGADHTAAISWIAAHAGQPQSAASPSSQHGLHGSRSQPARAPLRYVLPPGALD